MDKSPRTKHQKQKQNAKGDITIRTRFKGDVEVVWKTKQEKELGDECERQRDRRMHFACL
jgi:hypothetical protein